MSGLMPPFLGSLNINSGRFDLLNEFFCAIGKSGGRVGGPDQKEFSIVFGVFQDWKGVGKWIAAVSNAVGDWAVDIGLPKETMDDFGGHE